MISIEKEVEAAALYRDLLLSGTAELMRVYLAGVLNLIDAHNRQILSTKTVHRASFIGTFNAINEMLETAMADLTNDLVLDLSRAVEEYEDEE